MTELRVLNDEEIRGAFIRNQSTLRVQDIQSQVLPEHRGIANAQFQADIEAFVDLLGKTRVIDCLHTLKQLAEEDVKP